MRDQKPRRALVLAGGGVVGGLYEVGALIALDTVLEGFTACDFDLYVGSSAGALVAALLANDVRPECLRETIERDRSTLPRLAGSRFVSLPWRRYVETAPRLAAALPRVAIGATAKERTPISTAVAASAAVPVIFEPVRVDGVDYVDAAISKTAHAGLAIDRGATLVVTSIRRRTSCSSSPTSATSGSSTTRS
jgi:predicted acylesterase/phospholipase RssA